METREEVKVIRVDRECPYCHQGFLRPTGVLCSTNPPIRPHKCNNPTCNYGEVVTGNAYPYLEYEAVDNRIRMPNGEMIMGRNWNRTVYQTDENVVIPTEKPEYPPKENMNK